MLLALHALPGAPNRSFVWGVTESETAQEFHFRPELGSFLRADSVSPLPKGGILFIGSSIFRLWAHLKQQMAPLPVFNRAFGGSQTAQVLHYMDTIVVPYEPKIVVYYCGSNDINAGENAADIAFRIQRFHERLEEKRPGTDMFFVSINRALQKRGRWNNVDATNALIKRFSFRVPHLSYIDLNSVLFDERGEPRNDLCIDDKLHLRDRAYEGFAAVLKPVLEEAWNRK